MIALSKKLNSTQMMQSPPEIDHENVRTAPLSLQSHQVVKGLPYSPGERHGTKEHIQQTGLGMSQSAAEAVAEYSSNLKMSIRFLKNIQ
jgi:hypothetical protein